MWAIAIPTHSAVYFFVSYFPVLRPRISRNVSLIKKRIASINVNTKNLCTKNNSNSIIITAREPTI